MSASLDTPHSHPGKKQRATLIKTNSYTIVLSNLTPFLDSRGTISLPLTKESIATSPAPARVGLSP